MRYCGRIFSVEEIKWLKEFIADHPGISRLRISRVFCERFHWRKPDGGLKDMSCRVAFLKMDKAGLIRLPPAKREFKPGIRTSLSSLSDPGPEINKSAGELSLCLKLVDKKDSRLWNEFIERYHYLRYQALPGAQLRYFVLADGRILALLGFGAAAWKTAPRDRYIGWDADTRQKNLHLVINNARFLILPWVRCPNLASRVLSLVSRRLAADWGKRYNYQPVLLETFVEKDRFSGVCYKAANWICVGETRGRGKKDVRHENNLPVKRVWLYPLTRDFKKKLTGGLP